MRGLRAWRERQARDGDRHRAAYAWLGVDLFGDEEPCGAGACEGGGLGDAARADVLLHHLGWGLDAGNRIECGRREDVQRPTEAIAQIEERGLVGLLVDGGELADRARRE